MCLGLLTLLTGVIGTFVGTSTVSAQLSFPALLDVSRDQHVTSVPSSSVCGLSTVGSYCRSSTSATSVRRCLLSSCSSQCPRRTATPARCVVMLPTLSHRRLRTAACKPLSKSSVAKSCGSFSSPSFNSVASQQTAQAQYNCATEENNSPCSVFFFFFFFSVNEQIIKVEQCRAWQVCTK